MSTPSRTFKTLIGTVKRVLLLTLSVPAFAFQTLIGTVKSPSPGCPRWNQPPWFQTLIGTVKREGEGQKGQQEAVFQTLIGTVKRSQSMARAGARANVSNPHRYGQKDGGGVVVGAVLASFKPS